jgi:hypothetical protein
LSKATGSSVVLVSKQAIAACLARLVCTARRLALSSLDRLLADRIDGIRLDATDLVFPQP